MTIARKLLVDPQVTRYYHCISRCVRRAMLCGNGFEHRKQWIEDRLQTLAENFAISVAGFAVMDNHLHVLCRLDPDDAKQWSAEEVIRRWMAVYPPAKVDMNDPAVVQAWVEDQATDTKRVETLRERLKSLGWFMKALKEPLARMANKEDGCKGTFWEARYKSIAILDEEALLATCAYIDLNPVAAGIAPTPEASKHTSIRQRIQHALAKGKLEQLKAARDGSVAGARVGGDVEQDHWLVPIQDVRREAELRGDPVREGMLESMSLGSYLLLVDFTSRLHRQGKARVDPAVAEIFDRLGIAADYWQSRMKRMMSSRDLRGCFFAGKRDKLRELAANQGKRHLANLCPQPG